MSVLKTAWANLQDGLGNRFSWSHVKAIFYNYAEQKLLSTKLDEMDALIDEKIAKAMMSNVQVNDENKVPTSALAYAMQQQITENEDAISVLNSELINESGLGLTEGMYSIYAPNTADDMVYPGLYRLNGITVGSRPNFYGYAIVMSSLDHTIIKQLIYHNASSQSLLRYRFNNQWTDAGEFALKDEQSILSFDSSEKNLNDFINFLKNDCGHFQPINLRDANKIVANIAGNYIGLVTKYNDNEICGILVNHWNEEIISFKYDNNNGFSSTNYVTNRSGSRVNIMWEEGYLKLYVDNQYLGNISYSK